MSADRWSQCPNCLHKIDVEYNKQLKIVSEKYGQVSKEDYLKAMKFVDDYNNGELNPDNNLREDYYFSEPTLYKEVEYKYHASCDVCGFVIKLDGTLEQE